MIRTFSEWLQRRLLKEVLTPGGRAVYAKNHLMDREEEAGEEAPPINPAQMVGDDDNAEAERTARSFLGIQQKPGDKVYFGIHILADQLRDAPPGQPIALNMQDIDPYCGIVVGVDDGKDSLYVSPPDVPGRIHGLQTKILKRGPWAGNLQVPIKAFEEISDHVEGGNKVWLYAQNPYQHKVATQLRVKASNSAPMTPEQIKAQIDRIRGILKPEQGQKERVPSLDDLMPQEMTPQPEQGPTQPQNANIPYLNTQPQQPMTPQNLFGPSRSPLSSMVKNRTPKPMTSQPTDTLSLRDRRQAKRLAQQGNQGLGGQEVAWNTNLQYGSYWKMFNEQEVFPYYPE